MPHAGEERVTLRGKIKMKEGLPRTEN